jgi:predicted nucleic acid-binding protein
VVIVADSSVWIDALRGSATSETRRLWQAVRTGTVLVGDVILHEVLRGFRDDAQFDTAQAAMTALPGASFVGAEQAIIAARRYRTLRRAGITVRQANDIFIASYCISHDVPLLYSDRDFDPFVTHFALRRVSPADGPGSAAKDLPATNA